MDIEEQNNLEQETSSPEPEPKKDSIFKKGLTKVKNAGIKLGNFVETKIDTFQAHKEWNKHFELNASKFSVLPLNFENDAEYYKHINYIFAIKLADKQCLIVRKDDKLNVNQVLSGKQNQALQIVDFEDKTIPYPSSDNQYPIECIKYFYKPYSKPVSPHIQNITNNQTVTVEGNNSGDITLVADFSTQLAELEKAINDSHPSFFYKKKKEEAIKLYGNFKDCVINRQKDKSLFDKFKDVLKIIAPAAVSIVTAIIGSI